MTEEQKITYDIRDEVQFRSWLKSYIEAYDTRLNNIQKGIERTNSRLGILIFFFIIIPIILGFCSVVG